MILHKNKNFFKEVCSTVADELGLADFQVEKDYYVSLFLSELSKVTDIEIIFKGGTSLSKCYDIINRFSEDIDLAVLFDTERVTDSKRRKLKKSILEIVVKLNMKNLNDDEVRSRRDFNKYEISFDNK